MTENSSPPGMTLRDYFAAKIVTGLGNQCGDGCVGYMEQRARVAYQFADALIAERSKTITTITSLHADKPSYKNLGNLSAVDGWASVGLRCDICMVEWVGCWDEAACPQCGNHDSWDKLMKDRGHYGHH